MVVHIELLAAVPDCFEVIRHRVAIRVAHDARVRDEIRAALEIHEAHRACEIKIVFLPIQQVKHGHVMLVETQMFDAVEQRRHLREEVADDYHQRALPDALGEIMQRLHDVRFARRRRLPERLVDLPQMRRRAPRREIHRLLCEASEPHGVALMHEHVRESRREFARVIEARAALRRAREFHRGARVHHHVAAQIRVRLEFADEKFVRPRKHAPVEELDVVPRRILPVFCKLDRSSASRRTMQPVHRAEHRITDVQDQPREAADDPVIEEFEIWRRVSHDVRERTSSSRFP